MMSSTENDTLYLLSAMYAEAEKTFLQIKKQFPLWAAGEDTRRGEYLTALYQTWSSQMWLIKELNAKLAYHLPDLQRQEFNRLVVLDWAVSDIKKALHSPLIDRDSILHNFKRTGKLRKKYFLFSLFPQDLAKRSDIYLNLLQDFLSETKNIKAMDNDTLLSALQHGQSYFNVYYMANKSLHKNVKINDPTLKEFQQRLIDLKIHYHTLFSDHDTVESNENKEQITSNKLTKTYATLTGRSTFSLEKLEDGPAIFRVSSDTGLKGDKLAKAERRIYQDMLQELESPQKKTIPIPLEISLFEHVTLRERSRVEAYVPDDEMITVTQTSTPLQHASQNEVQKPSLWQNIGNKLARFFQACKRLVFPDPDAAFLARSKASKNIKQSQITQVIEESHSETEQQAKVQNIKTIPVKRAQVATEIKDEDDDIRPNGPKVR